jgi:hypothetical protein
VLGTIYFLSSILDPKSESSKLKDASVILSGTIRDFGQWHPIAACRNQQIENHAALCAARVFHCATSLDSTANSGGIGWESAAS